MAVVVPIAADYDDSGVKAAQRSIAQFGQTITKSLQAAGRESKRALAQLEEGATDSRTAAQRLADSIGKVADKLDADLTASTKAADALAQALGPDMAAKIGRNGVQKLVTDLNRAGLTLQEIEADAESLAGAIGRLDDINLRALGSEVDNLDSKINQVSASTDKSRSVMANFAGNAAQEIPGVSAAMGPLNVAIGQFAEYAAEGDVKLRGLLSALGPIAAAGGVLFLAQKAMAALAEKTKLAADQTKAVRDFILDAKDALTGLAEEATAAREIKVFDPTSGLFGGTVDATKAAANLGLKLSDLTDILRKGKGAVDEFGRSSGALERIQSGQLIKANDAVLVYTFLRDTLKALSDGTADASVRAAVFGTAQSEVARTTNEAYEAISALIPGVDTLTTKTQGEALAAERAALAEQARATAIDEARIAVLRATSATYNKEDAELRAEAAVSKAAAAEEKARKSRNPKDEAEAVKLRREAERAALDYAQASGQLEEATNNNSDAGDRAREVTWATADAYTELAQTLGPNSQLRKNLEAVYGDLIKLDRDWSIDVTVNGKPVVGIGMPGINFGSTSNATPTTVNNVTVQSVVTDPVAVQNLLDNLSTNQRSRLGE